jgi:hypothetical protein
MMMPNQTRTVSPSIISRSVRTATGEVLHPPADWVLVPPGDPGLTRRIKAAGPTWTVQEKKGRKIFSQGVWVSGAVVDAIRRQLALERATPQYARRREAGAQRREQAQTEYVRAFHETVLDFLAFAPRYSELAQRLAQSVTAHATPVGSGTVARTERIPVEQRAEAAVIAWMRHQTTAYDHMTIARIKGKRREVRRLLAARSHALLEGYRRGGEVDAAACPLQRVLARIVA